MTDLYAKSLCDKIRLVIMHEKFLPDFSAYTKKPSFGVLIRDDVGVRVVFQCIKKMNNTYKTESIYETIIAPTIKSWCDQHSGDNAHAVITPHTKSVKNVKTKGTKNTKKKTKKTASNQ